MSALALVQTAQSPAEAATISGGVATAYLLAAVVAFFVGFVPFRSANLSVRNSGIIGVVLAISVVVAVAALNRQ